MIEAAGYLLAGGKSSRFGSDKALLEIGGKPLLLHLADLLRQAAGNVTVVAPPERYQHLGLRVISDAVPEAGPLGGVVTALEDAAAPWIVTLACDLPQMSSEFLSFLLQQAVKRQAQVMMPIGPDGYGEPLCAVYSRDCHATMRQALDRGVRKMTSAMEALRVERLPPHEYQRFDPAQRLFTNINTPADWRQRPRR